MAEQTAKLTDRPIAVGASNQDRLLHTILSAAFSAMLVATPLMPSDTFSLAVDGQIAAPAMLWLMLAICASAARLIQVIRTKQTQLKWTLCDGLLALFFLWIVIASMMACANADRRAGWNMTASWVSLGLTYFLTRLLVRDGSHLRAMIVGILAVATMFAVEGIYESWVVIPDNQAKFRMNPQAVLREAGVSMDGGAVVYERFRSRLLTQHPAATFVLENSFAGFLIPPVILILGVFFSLRSLTDEKAKFLRRFALIVAFALLGYCVYLVHSTAAFVAIGVCLLIGAVDLLFRDQTRTARIMRGGAVAVLLVIFVWPLLIAFAGDAAASRLPQTLRFRAEYWQSCAAMLAGFPLWGCGPGNFQNAYARYMLPQAAETIADPHNLLWEVLATSGALAGLLFVGALVAYVRVPLSRFLQPSVDENKPRVQLDAHPIPIRALALGAVGGIPLALLLSLSSGSNFLLYFLRSWLFLGLLPGVALAFALLAWIRGGKLSTSVIWLAWLALAIHLTVSGGIGNPGTGTLFFLLLALTQVEGNPSSTIATKRTLYGGAGALVALICLALVHYQWGYVPVLASQADLSRADIAAATGNQGEVRKALEAAARADSWIGSPHAKLALLEFQDYLESASEGRSDPANLIAAAKAAVEKAKTSPTIYYEMALTLLRANVVAPHSDLIADARALLKSATSLAPSKAVAWAYLAYADHKEGDARGAKESAKEALRLDSLNPHSDRALGGEPSPIPGRSFPGWLRELAEAS